MRYIAWHALHPGVSSCHQPQNKSCSSSAAWERKCFEYNLTLSAILGTIVTLIPSWACKWQKSLVYAPPAHSTHVPLIDLYCVAIPFSVILAPAKNGVFLSQGERGFWVGSLPPFLLFPLQSFAISWPRLNKRWHGLVCRQLASLLLCQLQTQRWLVRQILCQGHGNRDGCIWRGCVSHESQAAPECSPERRWSTGSSGDWHWSCSKSAISDFIWKGVSRVFPETFCLSLKVSYGIPVLCQKQEVVFSTVFWNTLSAKSFILHCRLSGWLVDGWADRHRDRPQPIHVWVCQGQCR